MRTCMYMCKQVCVYHCVPLLEYCIKVWPIKQDVLKFSNSHMSANIKRIFTEQIKIKLYVKASLLLYVAKKTNLKF